MRHLHRPQKLNLQTERSLFTPSLLWIILNLHGGLGSIGCSLQKITIKCHRRRRIRWNFLKRFPYFVYIFCFWRKIEYDNFYWDAGHIEVMWFSGVNLILNYNKERFLKLNSPLIIMVLLNSFHGTTFCSLPRKWKR